MRVLREPSSNENRPAIRFLAGDEGDYSLVPVLRQVMPYDERE